MHKYKVENAHILLVLSSITLFQIQVLEVKDIDMTLPKIQYVGLVSLQVALSSHLFLHEISLNRDSNNGCDSIMVKNVLVKIKE